MALPAEPTSFVSRDVELETLDRLLGEHRLVSVVGSCGVGKTSLALRHGWIARRQSPAPIIFCDLVSATTGHELVDRAIAALRAMSDVSVAPADSVGVGATLAALGEVLVILDNFGQLGEAGSELVSLWLEMAPMARFLITARERLRLAGEVCLSLEPLPEAVAVELLALRAANFAPDFSVSEANYAAMVDICRQLDGLPLAIEMTAPWLQVLSAAELSERLARGLVLAWDGLPANPHHSSMESAIAWSWNLLSSVERDFMFQASVFRGRFTLEDVTAVCALEGDLQPPLTLLRRLRERSLIATHRRSITSSVEFSMGSQVRKFASARPPTPEARGSRDLRHRQHVLGLVQHLTNQLAHTAPEEAHAELARLSADLAYLREAPLEPRPNAASGEDAAGAVEGAPADTDTAVAQDWADGADLVLCRHGDWFAVRGKEPVRVGRRGPVRQLLLGLVEQRLRAPERAVSLARLFELGWPGERIEPSSAANRVYVALSALRRLGLGELILTRREGWLIDPSLEVRLQEPPPDRRAAEAAEAPKTRPGRKGLAPSW